MNEPTPKAFGLLGGFAGDPAKRARAIELAERLRGAQSDAVSAQEIIAVLELLPFSGRVEFVLDALCESPSRDRHVWALFDACFVDGRADTSAGDQASMLASLHGESTRVLAPERYYLVRLLTIALPRLGRLGVELFDAYQRSSSTVLFRPFLDAMVASKDFSDDELEAVFLRTVDASRKAILEHCKHTPHRQRFVARLIERELAPLELVYWADPAFIDARLARGTPEQIAALEHQGFRNWSQLGAVYLAHLRRAMQAHANDPLARGIALRAFEGRSFDLSAEHVVALVALCEEHQPLELAPTVSPAVRNYLEETSRAGAWAGPYEGVTLALPCDRLLDRLRADDKVALLRANITRTPSGWAFDESHRRLCETLLGRRARRGSARSLLARLGREAFEAISEEALWELRVGGAAADPVRTTFESFARALDVQRWHQNTIAFEVIEAWLALAQRSKPTPAVIARYEGRKSERELWTLWLRHTIELVQRYAQPIVRRAQQSLNRCNPRAQRSCITSYVRYATLLLGHLQSVLQTPGLQCDPTLRLTIASELAELTRPLFDTAAVELASQPESVGSQAVLAMRSVIEAALIDALSAASDALIFDPAREGYVSVAQHGQLAPALTRLCHPQNLSHCAELQPALYALCSALVERVKMRPDAARLGFVESLTRENKKSFVFFDPNAHKLWSGTALSLLTTLQAACNARGARRDERLCARVWSLFKREKYGAKLPRRSEKKFNEYVIDALALPPSVLAEEKPALIDAGVALCASNELDSVAATFARAGWLVEILDRAAPAAAVRDRFLTAHGEVSNPEVRVLLENATTDRDPAIRMQAHLTLLERSQHAIPALAESLAYVARRIRNEAGLHRPLVYQWITERIGTLVTRSLDAASDEQPAGLDAITVLCDALEKMLRDDVSKRDTVAKNAFRAIAANILSTALLFDCEKPRVQGRRRWIQCAVLLDTIVVRALHGEEGLRSFVWPLQGRTMPLQRTVPEAWLEAYLPVLRAHFRAGQSRLDELRISTYSQRRQRESDDAPRFDAAQAIDLLTEALGDAQAGASQPIARDELGDAAGFARSTSADSPLLRRAKALFAFAGAQWPAVPRLLQFFERTMGSLSATSVEPNQLRQALALFDAVYASYPAGVLWYELAPLAHGCEQLMRAAIRLSLSTEAAQLYPRWIAMRNGRGRTPLATTLSAAQTQHLLSEGAVREAAVLDNTHTAARRCETVRALLELTPSAAYCVHPELVSLRDDLLLEYTWKSRGELRGVFDPHTSAAGLTDTEARARAPLAVASDLWPTLNGRTMRTYTVAALEAALTVERSPQSRSQSVADFVRSPASSHVEVIELLRRLLQIGPTTAPVDGQEPGAASGTDEARELLLETVILCAFQTDAAWFVLSFLLSPEVIATSQRTTASLLTNLHSWVPMDRVVAVLRILLEPKRRWAIQVYLHKSIVRMLLETPSDEARALFANEWAQRAVLQMHPDVQHEMVKLAVGALASSDPSKAQLAWSIADEVARAHDAFDATTVLLLLLPVWTPTPAFAGQRALTPLFRVAVHNTDVPDSFGLLHSKWLAETPLYFTSTEVRDRLRALLHALEQSPQSYVRTLATCAGFALSSAAAGAHDPASFAQLQALLRAMSVRWESDRAAVFPEPGATESERTAASDPAQEYLLQVVPRLFAALVLHVLSHEQLQYTEHERQTGRALAEVCQKHEAARTLRALFGECLEALATIAPIHVERRARVARVAQGMLATAHEWASAKPLLTQHFQEALRFLRSDLDRVTPLL